MKYTFNFTPVSERLPEYGSPVLLVVDDKIQYCAFALYQHTNPRSGKVKNRFKLYLIDEVEVVLKPKDAQAWAYIDEAERVG